MRDMKIIWKRPEADRMVYLSLAAAHVLLHFCFFARCDDFVVQPAADCQSAWFFAFPPEIRKVIYTTILAGCVERPAGGFCQPAAGCHPAPRAIPPSCRTPTRLPVTP
jgi:hypothetical protein